MRGQTVWIQINCDVLSGLGAGISRRQKLLLAGKELSQNKTAAYLT